MAITRDDVIGAYKMFLNRAPESEAVIQQQMITYENVAAIRSYFAKSSEFKALVRQPENSFIPPFLLPSEKNHKIVIDVPRLEEPVSQMCTFAQFQEPSFKRICRALGLDPTIAHRKHWEWAYICRVLELSGVIRPGGRGLVFAVGRERLPAYFASKGVDILATDGPKDVASMWVSSNEFSDDEKALWYPEILPLEDFKKHVKFRVADMINVPEDL